MKEIEFDERDTNKGTMIILDHDITFLYDKLIIHKPKVPYEEKECNDFLKDGLLNHK